MGKFALIVLSCLLVRAASAAPPPPVPGDLYGWELPKLVAIDSIDFPKRLVRNRSYGRVVAEISLRRDGTRQSIEYTQVDNGDLLRWAEKILESASFTPARLDGSPLACRLPAHVLFLKAEGGKPARNEVWLPGDETDHSLCLAGHFLAVNEALPPLLLRAGTYDRTGDTRARQGAVTFQVRVNKDGSREEGRIVASSGDDFARFGLPAMVELQILPPRFRGASYGAWVRIQVGFFDDWSYPTRPVDRHLGPYLGWPAPVISPVGAGDVVPPQFQGVNVPKGNYDLTLLRRAGSIVSGHALFCVRVDTQGAVSEWTRARGIEPDLLRTDGEYSQYGLPTHPDSVAAMAGVYTTVQLAREAASEIEKILPYLLFLPARAPDGTKLSMWVTVTPAIFR